jgi:AcrR family transcriptional regulator
MTQVSERNAPMVTRINGDQTKKKILDAAEELFGEDGFDTVSLRDITKHAGVALALASYHFKTKVNLLEQVIARRADRLNILRRDRLTALQKSGGLTLETILNAFMEPLFTQMSDSDKGWHSYVMLLSKLGLSNKWLDTIRKNFDETAGIFITELRQVLPNVKEEDLMRSFSLVLHLMLQAVSKHQRLDARSDGAFRADDLDKSYAALLRFAVAGMNSASVTSEPKIRTL